MTLCGKGLDHVVLREKQFYNATNDRKCRRRAVAMPIVLWQDKETLSSNASLAGFICDSCQETCEKADTMKVSGDKSHGLSFPKLAMSDNRDFFVQKNVNNFWQADRHSFSKESFLDIKVGEVPERENLEISLTKVFSAIVTVIGWAVLNKKTSLPHFTHTHPHSQCTHTRQVCMCVWFLGFWGYYN